MKLINKTYSMIKLLHADCLEILKKFRDNYFDLILTDPPYCISSEIKITRTRNTMKFKATTDLIMDMGEWDHFVSEEDFWGFTYSWVDKCVRVLRDGGMFITYFDRDKINFISHHLQKKHNFKSKGYFAHIKSNPVPQARKVKWMNAFEIVGLWQKPNGKLTYNYQLGQQADYIIVPIVGGKERLRHPNRNGALHPTQKPLKVMELFIKYWTNEGDKILDPFAGTATTLIAAHKLNRHCIGIEKNDLYYKEALKRIEEYTRQSKLF